MANATTRPAAPLSHPDEKEHRRQIALRANAGLATDGSTPMQNPVPLAIYTVATVPDATVWDGAIIHVSDETGGAITAFSDGTNWRRSSDRAIVS